MFGGVPLTTEGMSFALPPDVVEAEHELRFAIEIRAHNRAGAVRGAGPVRLQPTGHCHTLQDDHARRR